MRFMKIRWSLLVFSCAFVNLIMLHETGLPESGNLTHEHILWNARTSFFVVCRVGRQAWPQRRNEERYQSRRRNNQRYSKKRCTWVEFDKHGKTLIGRETNLNNETQVKRKSSHVSPRIDNEMRIPTTNACDKRWSIVRKRWRIYWVLMFQLESYRYMMVGWCEAMDDDDSVNLECSEDLMSWTVGCWKSRYEKKMRGWTVKLTWCKTER